MQDKINKLKLAKKILNFSGSDITSSSFSVFLSYFLAFILCSAIAVNFEQNTSLIVGSFLLLFGIAAIFNYWQIQFAQDVITGLNSEIDVLKNAFQSDYAYGLITSTKGEVYYTDSKIRHSNLPKSLQNLDEIDLILGLANVPFNLHQQIREDIFNPGFSRWGNSMQKIYPFNIDCSIILTRVEGQLRAIDKELVIMKVVRAPIEMLENYLDHLNISFYELDPGGEIIECSTFFAKTLGYKKSNLVNHYVKFQELIDLEGSMDNIISSSHGIAGLLGNWQGFLKLKSNYRERIPFFILHKVELNSYGNIKKIRGYAVRVLDPSVMIASKNAEQGWLDYSWQCFFENSPYPVAIVNRDATVSKMNKAFEEIMHLENHSVANFFDLFNKEDQASMQDEFSRVWNPKLLPKPVKNVRTLDTGKVFDVYMGKILNLKGDTTSLMVRVADVTSQKELQDNLSHAQRMQTIGQLVGSVAHDFNNLLTAISGFCDLLFLKHTVGDPSFAHIMQIKQNSDRAANLVKRLLAFSRKQTLQLSTVNLSDLFSDFTTLIKRLVGNDFKLNMEIDPNLWYVKVDPVQMEQVILNLVVNAHQASDSEDGVLNITLKNEAIKKPASYLSDYFTPDANESPNPGDYVVIEVSDNGHGIPKEILPKIFEPFFTTKIEKSGTGLGLSTVYGIIRQSEGYIYVKSSKENGTTFKILLRKYSAPSKVEVAPKVAQAVNFDLAKGTIALIEDEDSVRLFTKNVLTSRGYEVIEYSSAKDAFTKIDEFINKIDLIVSDVMMPEMNGPTLITEVQKRRPDIKVIFISGYAEEAFSEEYGSNRDFNFLPKPFSLKQLLEKVQSVLGS